MKLSMTASETPPSSVGVQVDDLRPVPFRDYHREGAEDPALAPCVPAESRQPFPYAVRVLLGDQRGACDVSQPLVPERDPAVVQLDEDPFGDQALQQGPAPLAAGQQPFGDALDVGAVPGAAAELRELADAGAGEVAPLVVVAAAGLGQALVDCLDERAGDGRQPGGAEAEPRRAQRVQCLAGELQVQRIAELGVQGRERRRLKPVLPGEPHDRGVGRLREPEVLDPRQLLDPR